MKKIVFTILMFFLFVTMAFADTFVNGYTRRDGTYVQPHYRSDPNSTTQDNWSHKGNVNPHTGQKGYRNDSDGRNSSNPPGIFGR